VFARQSSDERLRGGGGTKEGTLILAQCQRPILLASSKQLIILHPYNIYCFSLAIILIIATTECVWFNIPYAIICTLWWISYER